MEYWRLRENAFVQGLHLWALIRLRGIQGLFNWLLNWLWVFDGDDVGVRVRIRCSQVYLWRLRGRNVDAPKSGARWFARSAKDVVTRAVVDCDVLSIYKCGAASIAQFAQADEVVRESWDDVAGACCHAR